MLPAGTFVPVSVALKSFIGAYALPWRVRVILLPSYSMSIVPLIGTPLHGAYLILSGFTPFFSRVAVSMP